MLQEQQPLQPQEPQQPAPKGSNKKWIALAIGGGCSLLACAVVIVALAGSALYPLIRSSSQAPTALVQQVPATMDTGAPTQANVDPLATLAVAVPQAGNNQPANTMGDPNAPVKIVEYADFQCPYCMEYSKQTEPQIIAKYVKTGKVFYEYHSVGAFLGPESGAAAQAAYCAGDQGKFWEYHDTLFSNWTGENVGDFANDKLLKFAASLGLDQPAFSKCLSSGKFAARLDQDVTDAKAAGVRATPSFVINGKLVEGALPFSDFQQAIEAALQGK